MGEVYRATDTNLKRQVALKVLPDSFANDPERLARFQREAEVLAALNHPNIAAIYGLERSGPSTGSGQAVLALVMELVEGPTLADRLGDIARHKAHGATPDKPSGGLSLEEALPIAKQIADALEAAHELGIVHRDIKPANVKVRADGVVKVLDFGLAKAMEQGKREDGRGDLALAQAPTITSPALMTGAGMILGTAAYMSPEQAKGRTVDKRADIWAFGVVVYEMLTGRRLFDAEDVSETLAAVLTRELGLTALPTTTPARVRGLVRIASSAIRSSACATSAKPAACSTRSSPARRTVGIKGGMTGGMTAARTRCRPRPSSLPGGARCRGRLRGSLSLR